MLHLRVGVDVRVVDPISTLLRGAGPWPTLRDRGSPNLLGLVDRRLAVDLHLEVLLFELLRERPAALTLILLVKLHLLLLQLLRGSDIEVVNYVGDVRHAIRRVWVCGILRRV